MRKVSNFFIVCMALISFMGCRGDIDAYDEAPDWLRGNAYQYMKSEGNFTLFLEAIDLTGYESMVNGKGLCTVFAPDDDAFRAWMSANGYASLSEVNPAELKNLVGYHLVQQAFSRSQLLNFQMSQEAAAGSSTAEAGLSYKYKTYAKADPVEMFNPALQQNVKVYQREKYLPVISTKMFETQKCTNFEQTYKYFFPDVNWQGDNDKLYVANASIKEVGIPTDNGYIYVIDKVVTPRQTIYEALQTAEQGKFSTFLSFFDRFQNFVYDKTLSEKYAAPGEKYYLFYHNAAPKTEVDLPEIASEWSYHGEEDNKRPSYIRYLSDCYNCFAFDNKTFQDFFEEFFTGYENMNDLPDIALYYLLKSHADDHQKIMLPDKIEQKGIAGMFGEEWKINIDDNITYREFCANGLLYGVNEILRPAVFDVITKPLFQFPNYSVMTYMFNITNEFVTVVDREKDHYTLFILSDETLNEKYGMRVNYKDLNVFGDEKIGYKNDDGKTVEDGSGNPFAVEFLQTHIIYGAIKDFSQRAFYGTKSPFHYIYVDKDTVYGENGAAVEVIGEGWETENGMVYEIDSRLELSKESTIQAITERPQYTDFFKALQTAELAIYDDKNTKWTIPFLDDDERYMVFAPQNGTLNNAPTDKEELAAYLRYFFIPVTMNKMSDYILPNLGEPGTLSTFQENPELSTPARKVYNTITVNFHDNNSVELVNKAGNQRILTNGSVPLFLTDGLIYNIDETITVE